MKKIGLTAIMPLIFIWSARSQDFAIVGGDEEICHVLVAVSYCPVWNEKPEPITHTFYSYNQCMTYSRRWYGPPTPGSWVAENCERYVIKDCEVCASEKNKKKESSSGIGQASYGSSSNHPNSGSQNASTGSNSPTNAAKRGTGMYSQSSTPTTTLPSTSQEISQTIINAAPGIQNAVSQYRTEKQIREAQIPTYDVKPEGYRSTDQSDAEWVTAAPTPAETALLQEETWHQVLENVWEGVHDFFGVASTSAEILGYEEEHGTFETISDVMSYLETGGKLLKALNNPGDDQARLELAQDAFEHAADHSGVAGASLGKFAPPVDLQKRTFEGALNRMSSLINTGDPGDELQVTAPLADWFGSIVGLGDLGTRERNFRMEGYMTFSELKNRYGYVEAAKQKFYNWIHD